VVYKITQRIKDMVESHIPLSNMGIDFAGPLYERDRNVSIADKEVKICICLYNYIPEQCTLEQQLYCNLSGNFALL